MTEQQPELEPVAYMRPDKGHLTFHKSVAYVPLYTEPPKRKWVGLTEEEIQQGNKQSWVTQQAFESAVWWAEQKLKEKNA